MKKLATLVAGLLFVCGVANAADYSVTSEVSVKNGPYGRAAGDFHPIEWEVAKGYMALGDSTTFTFNVKKTFQELSDAEASEFELGLVEKLPATEFAGKTFSNEVALRYKVEGAETDTTSLTYVTGTDFAGVSTTLEVAGKLAESEDKYDVNLYLGKALGDNLSLSVEAKTAIDPEASGDDEFEFALNTFLNYNYDLGMGFSFNTECALKTGSEFETAEAYVAPQLKYGYSLAVNENTSFYTGVVYEALKYKTDNLGDDDFEKVDGEAKAYLGFTYAK
jgi:opacity protein-like surface antigen